MVNTSWFGPFMCALLFFSYTIFSKGGGCKHGINCVKWVCFGEGMEERRLLSNPCTGAHELCEYAQHLPHLAVVKTNDSVRSAWIVLHTSQTWCCVRERYKANKAALQVWLGQWGRPTHHYWPKFSKYGCLRASWQDTLSCGAYLNICPNRSTPCSSKPFTWGLCAV